jgi:hypothetical protein
VKLFRKRRDERKDRIDSNRHLTFPPEESMMNKDERFGHECAKRVSISGNRAEVWKMSVVGGETPLPGGLDARKGKGKQ